MTLDVIIEIIRGDRNKYELDKESGKIKLDRVLRSSVGYPTDYGYVENTLSDDGDPLDVMVINRFSTFPGCVVPTRPLGVFYMIDGGDNDEKILAVPEGDAYFDSWKDLNDVPENLIKEIEEFYKTYKNLEPGKTVEVKGWGSLKEAEELIERARKNHK